MKFCKETVNIFDHFAAFWWHFRNIQPTREEVETYALKFLAWKHMPAFFFAKRMKSLTLIANFTAPQTQDFQLYEVHRSITKA